MPSASGFEVLQKIGHVPQVIFTTAYDKYAIQAFETNGTDYLLKPALRQIEPQQIPPHPSVGHHQRTAYI